MSVRWQSATPPEPGQITWGGAVLAVLRGCALVLCVFGGLAVLLALRLVERPVCGDNRPVTPLVTCAVCRVALRIMGLRLSVSGAPMQSPGLIVANHSSWLDIFVLNATAPIYFVSKSEVAGWPGIGWLARATGTVFVERAAAKARLQAALISARLRAGHRLLFFPEGTSSDGLQVLPFKSSLFASMFDPDLQGEMHVQPVSVVFHVPSGVEPRFYGWWGDMTFGAHFVKVLSRRSQAQVSLQYHTPLPVRDFANRKDLATACEAQIRTGHAAALGAVQKAAQ